MLISGFIRVAQTSVLRWVDARLGLLEKSVDLTEAILRSYGLVVERTYPGNLICGGHEKRGHCQYIDEDEDVMLGKEAGVFIPCEMELETDILKDSIIHYSIS